MTFCCLWSLKYYAHIFSNEVSVFRFIRLGLTQFPQIEYAGFIGTQEYLYTINFYHYYLTRLIKNVKATDILISISGYFMFL